MWRVLGDAFLQFVAALRFWAGEYLDIFCAWRSVDRVHGQRSYESHSGRWRIDK
jgi:hypothetical protein